jgi:glycosyltransferase involved in cell wall biosynthesis
MRVAEKGIRDHSKLITVYDGTHIPKSSLTPYELRNKFNLSKEHFVIGNIANHIRAKHLDTLIDIADELVNRRKIKELIFVQIGMFTDRTENLKRRVEALNLEDHVHFLGYLKDAPNFIPQFDLSLMTSQSEGLPHFIYESMYFKVPVVSTDVGGIREVIVNGKNGYLSPKHNAVSLGENILKLKADPVMREKFAQLSYERLMDGFTTEVMAEQTYKVYKEIMDELPK